MKVFFKIFLSLLFYCFFLSCTKKVGPVLPTLPETPVDTDTANFSCPTQTVNSQFQRDSLSDNQNHLIEGVKYSPSDPNLIVYCQYSNKTLNDIYSFNFLTKERHLLAKGIIKGYDINKNGWVIFDQPGWNIFKVKTNGDSLTQLTFSGACFAPRWDYTDTALYYFYHNTPIDRTIKISQHGKKLDSILSGDFLQAYSKISNKIAYTRPYNGSTYDVGIYIMDMNSKTETLIAHGTGDVNPTALYCFDKDDKYLYGMGGSGIIRLNIATQTSEVIIKNDCPDVYFIWPDIARGSSKLTCGWSRTDYIKMKPGMVVIKEFRGFEFDANDLGKKPKNIKPY